MQRKHLELNLQGLTLVALASAWLAGIVLAAWLPLSTFALFIGSCLSTVAKTVSYPMQSSAIHTIAGKQPWAVTIGGRLKHANQDSNRFFPIESGEHGGSSAATATPNRWPYRSPA